VDDVIAYRTVEAPASSRPLLRQALDGGGFDAVVFTSGSTIRGLQSLAVSDGLDVRPIPAICIGPETASVAAAAGFSVLTVASGHAADALRDAVVEALSLQPMEVP
jgi:uroporphyrinogen III methyltransferase/synthase